MPVYIYQRPQWPFFQWDQAAIASKLGAVRHEQGRLLGRMESLGFPLQSEANLQTITLDVVKSSEIEGEFLQPNEVRSSVARRLRMDVAGLVPSDRTVDGVVDMMLDATQQYMDPLTHSRLFGWHAALFPDGSSGRVQITTGRYRENAPDDPMQVVSGHSGRQRVHFQAPDACLLPDMMDQFLRWFNQPPAIDPVLQAAIAHLWFVTIHPFEDGNGRMARAITDMLLCRADGQPQRFYSMSAQIRLERPSYYRILEETQQGDLDITPWLDWFLDCLQRSIAASQGQLSAVLQKALFWEKHRQTAFNERQRTMLNKLLDGFAGKLTSSKWASITKTSQDTAGRDINDLVEKGVLVRESAGGRSTAYTLILPNR